MEVIDTLFSQRDVNHRIVYHLMDGTETWNYSMLRRLYRLFGKSRKHQLFLEYARRYFFESMFHRYNVSTLYALLCRKIHANPCVQGSIFNEFRRGIAEGRPSIMIESALNRQDRCIVRYMALYYGYLYLVRAKIQYDYPGDAYERIHESPTYKNQVITYKFLRRFHIDNLAYYDLVIDSPYKDKRAYRLKDAALIKGIGYTEEFHYVECMRMLDTVII